MRPNPTTRPSVGRNLQRLAKRMSREMDSQTTIRQLDSITGNNIRILCFLYEQGSKDVFQKDLEQEFGITRSTASKVLGLMEQKELIRRESVAQDARLKKLVLTDRSRGLYLAMRANGEAMDQRLLRGFSEKEQTELLGYLERMLHNLD